MEVVDVDVLAVLVELTLVMESLLEDGTRDPELLDCAHPLYMH